MKHEINIKNKEKIYKKKFKPTYIHIIHSLKKNDNIVSSIGLNIFFNQLTKSW